MTIPNKMKAMVFKKAGEPLELMHLPVPTPNDNQVLIKIHACGVCRTDLHIVDGELTEPKKNLIPGHEIVGTVMKTGKNVKDSAIRSGCRGWGTHAVNVRSAKRAKRISATIPASPATLSTAVMPNIRWPISGTVSIFPMATITTKRRRFCAPG